MQRWERMSFDMCVECTRPEEALVTRYECKGMCAQPSARPAHNEKAAAEQMKARVLRRWHVPGRLVPRPRKDFEHACWLFCACVLGEESDRIRGPAPLDRP